MKNYGVKFDEGYYTDLNRRIKTDIFIQRKLYERFGDLGMGDPNPEPIPVIGFGGQVNVCAMFSARVKVTEEGSPWVEKGILRTEEDILNLKVPKIEETWPQTMFIEQFDKYSAIYGVEKVVPPGVHGVLEMALDLRKEEFFVDMRFRPYLAKKLLDTLTQTVINVRTFWDKKKFGRVQNSIFAGGCSSTVCSPQVYEEFLVPYYNILSEKFGGCHLCSCGKSSHLLESFTRINNLRTLHLGWGTNLKKARKVLNGIELKARIDPGRIASATPEQVRKDVIKLLEEDDSRDKLTVVLANASADTPDENVRMIFDTVKEYGSVVSDFCRIRYGGGA